MKGKHKLLVATTSQGQNLAKAALSRDYDLVFASSLQDAKHILFSDSEIAMIIAGVHFDESRMVELLEFVRTTNNLEEIPFLIIQAIAGTINHEKTIGSIARSLGCCGFLDLHAMRMSDAKQALLDTVSQSFGKPVQDIRIDKKRPK